jgi:hypothetical protein
MEGVDKLFVQLHPSSRISVKKECKVFSTNNVDVQHQDKCPQRNYFLVGKNVNSYLKLLLPTVNGNVIANIIYDPVSDRSL